MNLIKSLAASVDKAKTEKLLTNALSELRALKITFLKKGL